MLYGLQIWPVHSQGPSKQNLQKSIKISEKKDRGGIHGLPKVLKYPLLSQERVKKATDFKYGRNIHAVHPNKSPLKILEKWDCPNFFGYPLLFL